MMQNFSQSLQLPIGGYILNWMEEDKIWEKKKKSSELLISPVHKIDFLDS